MIEFIGAVDPRPNAKTSNFVSVAQALGRGLVRPCCHARKRDRFSAHRKPQKSLIDLAYFNMWPHHSPTFFREEPIKEWNELATQWHLMANVPAQESGKPSDIDIV